LITEKFGENMASRKLLRDFLLSHRSLILPQQQVRSSSSSLSLFIIIYFCCYYCRVWRRYVDTVCSMSSLTKLKMKLLSMLCYHFITFTPFIILV